MTQDEYTLAIVKQALIEAAHWRVLEHEQNGEEAELVARNAYYNILDRLDGASSLPISKPEAA